MTLTRLHTPTFPLILPRPSDGQLALLGLAVIGLAATFVSADPTANDFTAFYQAAQTWAGAIPQYPAPERPNLNPPTLTVLLRPLVWLPIAAAWIVWTLVGALALVASVRRAATRWTAAETWWALGALGAFYPCIIVWREGQLTWFLLYPVTRAWLASTPLRAGLWLAPAIAIKPPLALMAILLPWPIALTAGAGSLGVTLLSVLVTGLEPWREWLALSGSVSWIGWPLNLSLFGVAARLETGASTGIGVTHLSAVSLGLIAVAAGALAWSTVRSCGGIRWTRAVLWSLFVSPAGWVYYLPLVLGPVVSGWRRNRWTLTGLALVAIPLPALALVNGSPLGVMLGGSCYPIGALCLWRGLRP